MSASFVTDKLRKQHLEILSQAFFANIQRYHDGEYGSIGLDAKRPFGNSDVEQDILVQIGMPMEGNDGYDDCYSSGQRNYAGKLYNELADYIRERYLLDPKIIEEYSFRWNKK